MFTEIIAVYSEITAEYINKFCKEFSENFDVVATDTYQYLCGLMLENISLASTNSFRKN
jgi:hypothetical protein